ncbi:hypothetical protein [Lysinibacillus pakistanensis]|uniref:Transglycosylase n=1 Tax=Lysinibacillus pakistanensis TaxID=759811 RepID=A0ABX6DD88_9BACI|nr:hypothetical protein GDS87_11835 [Lysinibacillus pakistanensis]
MEPIYAKCNKSCGHRFFVKHFKLDKLHDTIQKTYYTCPNCNREYVCFYTDEPIRKLQAKMRELQRKIKWASGDTFEQLKQDEAELKHFIAQCMSGVKREVEHEQQQTL